MSDDNANNLENILADFESQTPTLETTLAGMDNQHLEKAAQAVMVEYNKRLDPLANVGNLNDAEFRALRDRYGV